MSEIRENLRKVATGVACLAERKEMDVESKSRYHSLNGAKPDCQMRANKLNFHKMKKFFVMLVVSTLSFSTFAAKPKEIHVSPDNARISIGGTEVGTGYYSLTMNKN